MSPPPSLYDAVLAAWQECKAEWERDRAAELDVPIIPLIDVAEWTAMNPAPTKPRRTVRAPARTARRLAVLQRAQADRFHAVARGGRPRVIQAEQNSLERALRCESVAARGLTRPTTRRRGAGRPRAQAARSSSRSGDSGSDDGSDDGSPHRQETAPLRLAPTPRAVLVFGAKPAADMEAGR